MSVKPIWVFFNAIFLILLVANSEEEGTIKALVTFMDKLAPGFVPTDPSWGWNLSSDPCIDKWYGVKCHSDNKNVMSVTLEKFNFGGGFDAGSLCITKSLQMLSLKDNSLHDSIPEDIGNCKSLTHLFLSGNQFSGNLPISVGNLSNIIRLHISDNHLTGELPKMVHVSSLISFVAQNNNFTGEIPSFDFYNLQEFNVSNNNLHGPVPDVGGKFHADSFTGNPNLCGEPLSNACPPPPPPPPSPSPPPSPPSHEKDKKSFPNDLFIYSGYLVLGLITLIFLTFKLLCNFKTKEKVLDVEKKEKAEESVGVVGMAGEISQSNGSKKYIGIRSEPPVAYYCSQQEKLLAYEFMQNGSLFMLLYAGKW
ncbi:probable inactive receptor kinase At2g26730 [Vigna radiata var. radiata]|uniref:Probable inactive receptor kinase At2g26730 n=1 Tax=Vigna radiata var. radiata TaxID=3916 RepID=A0A3Q0F0M3_VIGRR|nr:probable inactive receptor kinase At2g26730 [Vigna radiata var. radiata]